jgi:hypothetical protein
MEGTGPVDLMVVLSGFKRLIRQAVLKGALGVGRARRVCG